MITRKKKPVKERSTTNPYLVDKQNKYKAILRVNHYVFDKSLMGRHRKDGRLIKRNREIWEPDGDVYRAKNMEEVIGYLAIRWLILVYC